MPRILTLSVILALLSGGCGGGPDLGGERTYYEALDFSSPEAGVETLVEAFAADDFMTVYFAFDREAQFRIQESINLLEYYRLLQTEAVADFPDEIARAVSFETMETAQLWYLFDQIMLVADEHDAFLVDLSGGLESLKARGSSDLLATIKGIEGDVAIKMTESPAGNWRVNQVIVPGGDEDNVPWAVP